MHVVEQINLTKLVDCFWMVTIYDGMASVRLPNSVLSNTSDVHICSICLMICIYVHVEMG